ncbi:hypothetical protein CFAM422_007128 [Trichoderma lentiforme]|uniref:Uncharacterized protein n=1 Tax=Trichoderma lentiforme TaxID=1567552 RepID=A0A9P4XDA2_9HYPO|nr:hypothetical protein CFAM422_007128 [Trichoderma lentiforme]
MSSHIKHHDARASQELAQPIDKVSREGSSVGEPGCCPITGKICEDIVKLGVDVVAVKMEKIAPKYDSQAFEKHLRRFVKEHASNHAADDASKSDEKTNREKTAKAKDHLYDKVVHKTFEIAKAKISHAKTHDFQEAKKLFHETKDEIKHEFGSQYQEVVDSLGEVVCKYYEEFKTDLCEAVTYVGEVLKNDFSEIVTYVGEETEGLLTELTKTPPNSDDKVISVVKVDDGATQALRKLVKQVAFEYTIEVVKFLKGVVIKREERREKKDENGKYDFDFERFVELFEDPANFYTTINVYADFDFYADFGFEGFVELFEDEDDYVMVDRNTMMPSATGDEVLATEVTEKAAARTRTWWLFW